MIYNSFNFIILFPLIFLLYYVIPSRMTTLRNLFLLAVSYLLYLQWKPVYALILLFVTAVTYLAARLFERSRHPKGVLVTGIILALLPLVFFKYFNFINENINSLMTLLGIKLQLQGLNWAIPIGISFFTFQALSYMADAYQKKLQPEKNFATYALFVSFFPSILSGPINRATSLLPQFNAQRPQFDYSKAVVGLKLLLWGMFMKVGVADRVALYVDTVFGNFHQHTGLSCFLASIFYTIQIYADFAGYSLMAIGVGKVLGFELMTNFMRPYFAVSVTDFWHRWHISLSTWLRDYIYIPLGGSRCSKLRNYWNIFVTFFVSGVWHGANWTFIVWGCMHGISQIIEKMLGLNKTKRRGFKLVLSILVTFLIVSFAWILFRLPTIEDTYQFILRIFDFNQPMNIFIPENYNLIYMLMAVCLLFAKEFTDEFLPGRFLIFDNKRRWIRWSGYVTTMLYILVAGVFGADQFIYAIF